MARVHPIQSLLTFSDQGLTKKEMYAQSALSAYIAAGRDREFSVAQLASMAVVAATALETALNA